MSMGSETTREGLSRLLAHVRDDGRGGFVIYDLDEHLRGVVQGNNGGQE